MAENTEKKKALEAAMSQIEKQFGKGSVMKLGEFKAMEIEAIPTGALSLDMALGIGGVPRGRIIEVFGPESSGKTTLALHVVAEAQKMGGEAAFIDAEHALDPVYAKKLGVNISEDSGFITCKCDKIIGTNIDLDFPSVGATENIILASVYADGTTKITNAAMEPEIVDLAKCLNKMGAKIEGAGTNVIKITGVKKLNDVSYSVMPDRIEAGTLLCAVAITGGNVKLKNVIPEHINQILAKLEQIGCEIEIEKRNIYLKAPKKLKAVDIKTMPYPGFPTDMQSVFGAMLTIAKGNSIIIENIFENRFRYVNELKRMGAKVSVEGKIAILKGVRRLSGTTVESTDLRGGAALVIAGLAAKGTTIVRKIEYILRGYEGLDKKLNKLGAKIVVKEE